MVFVSHELNTSLFRIDSVVVVERAWTIAFVLIASRSFIRFPQNFALALATLKVAKEMVHNLNMSMK